MPQKSNNYIKGNPRELTTLWFRKVHHLAWDLLPNLNPVTMPLKQWDKCVEDAIHSQETRAWLLSMSRKSTLEIYRVKQDISRELIYDNSKGNDLLFKARAGSLETQSNSPLEW